MPEGNKILLLDTIHPVFTKVMAENGFALTDGSVWSFQDICSRIGIYNGVIIRSRIRLDGEVLQHASKLKFIARAGAGMENIDMNYAAAHGIACLHAPEGNSDAVGEHAIGMLLVLMNHLIRADGEVRQGLWRREANRGTGLRDKTVGVIGYGNMGSAFVRKLAGFDVKVLIYDKYKTFDDGPYFRSATMEELYEESDILSLHVPLTVETRYLVDDGMLRKFRKNIWLVNTARGPVVSTADLVKNMTSGKVAGAALDVIEYEAASFEQMEPGALPEPFRYLVQSDRVVLSPHIAGWTHESSYNIAFILAQKILKLYGIII